MTNPALLATVAITTSTIAVSIESISSLKWSINHI